MATSIFFGGRRINEPGAYSVINASALAGQGIGPVGIVAFIGTAEGGKPLTVDREYSDHTRPETVYERYRSGELRTASIFAFENSLDDAIPGGPSRLVNVKVNPATAASLDLDDDDGDASGTVTARDWGLFTDQYSIEIAAGTTQGKKITVVFEDTEEVFDDVGGTEIFDLIYTPGAAGYATATGLISPTSFTGIGTGGGPGMDGERTADIAAPGTLEYVSSNAADTTQTLTVYGIDNTNAAVRETVVLNGTVAVAGAQVFKSVFGVRMSAVSVGNITVRSTVPTTLFTLNAGTTTRGIGAMTNAPIVTAGSTLSIDVLSAGAYAMVVTQNAAGAEVMQAIDCGAALTTGLTGAGRKVLYLVLGDVPAARTLTLSAQMFSLPFANYSTVQKVVDALNALDGCVANAVVSNPTTFLMTDADRAPAASFHAATGKWYADVFAFGDALNRGSALLSFERAASPDGALVPANTVGAVFLNGGGEGTPTLSEWSQAFTLLKKRRVNIIVPLTRDSAVHALLAQHLKLRAGVLKSEANGYVGVGTADGAGETLNNIRAQIRNLGTRHISAIVQEMQRNDPDTGNPEWYPPHIFAAVAAGMQAGSTIGEPLTRKRPAVLDIRNDPSWTVEDNKSEMIDFGAMIAEKDDADDGGGGIRWVRSITTHLADDNPVYTEMSANEAANTAVYELRRRLDKKVGNRGIAGSAASLKGLASAVLGELLDDNIVVQWRALKVEQIGDVFPISVELAPVLPINFIPVTVHLIAVRLAA